MNEDRLAKIVEAVLYEGHILYPYRAASTKSRQRFTFGRVYPQAYHLAQDDGQSYTLQTECLVHKSNAHCTIHGGVHFLQPVRRLIGQPKDEIQDWPPNADSPPEIEFVQQLEVDGQLYPAWQECVERRVAFENDAKAGFSTPILISFPESVAHEVLSDRHGHMAGLIVRRQEALEGLIEVTCSEVDENVSRLTVHVSNTSAIPSSLPTNEQEVLMRTFASAHVVLHVSGGEFLSLTDPPAEYRPASHTCKNVGCWPVLVGDEAGQDRDTLLASPITLPDYPTVAAASTGTIYDGLETGAILALRIFPWRKRKRKMQCTRG